MTIETLHQEVMELKKEVATIKARLDEETELTDEAKEALARARATPESEYIRLDSL